MIRQFVLVLGAAAWMAASAHAQSVNAGASANASGRVSEKNVHASGNTSASSAVSANPNSVNAGLSSGTAFNTELTKPVDAKNAKPGDMVEARTTEAVKAGNKTVIPKGAKVMGHVTQASARAKGDSQSAMGIAFDRAVLKDGTEVPLNVGIQALASSQLAAGAAESNVDSMTTAGATAGARGGAGASGSSRGGLGGLTSTAGGVVGGAVNTTGGVVNSAGSVASNTTATVTGTSAGAIGGLTAAGQLTSNSRGVFGLNGLNLDSTTAGSAQGSLLTSADKNIHLASGTKMLLTTQATADSR